MYQMAATHRKRQCINDKDVVLVRAMAGHFPSFIAEILRSDNTACAARLEEAKAKRGKK